MGRRKVVFLVVLVCLGALLRLYRMRELGTFRGDQAIELTATAGILKGKLTLIGIKTSISEVRNGAVMYYVMAPYLYFFHFDPIAGGVVQSVLSLSAVVVGYYIGKRYISLKTGFFTGFVLATSALLVRFSRQTLLAFYPLFFCSLSLLFIGFISKKFSRKACLFLGILSGYMLQVHFSTVSVIWCVLLTPLFFLRKKYWKSFYAYIFLGFTIGFLPMIAFDLRHDFFTTRMFISYLAHPPDTVSGHLNIIFYWQDTVAKLLFGGNITLANVFIVSFFLLLMLFWKHMKSFEKICTLQIVVTVIFTALFVHEYGPHYAIPSFIPLILLTGSLLERFTNTVRVKRTYLNFVITVGSIGFFILQYPAYGFNDNHGWSMKEGWNLQGIEKSARLIAGDVKTIRYNVAMVVDAENQGLPLRYFLDVWGKPPLPVDTYDKIENLYVVVEPGTNIDALTMWEITSFGAHVIEKQWPIQNGFFLYRLGKKQV